MSGDLKFSVLAAARVFAEAEWTYGRFDGNEHIPDAEELCAVIQRLARDLSKEPGTGVSTGRLEVLREDDGAISVFLKLGEIDEVGS